MSEVSRGRGSTRTGRRLVDADTHLYPAPSRSVARYVKDGRVKILQQLIIM